ncbi:hypothetical protein M419DRAFT_85974 [Trichoderma reesei RUT C-30]|uniref:Uncharacterized protein n=1 Tax=Hypocrea jecorina (strain ATCC 56765 / BCRC 32924 / NRRL 11460 / Rut C-30) TaxID=1344414 RepID=A0A024S343_HYPJR|nr:hypothetical protein M419DRAFT_85974 [Trichoderma reesei RUT C-30]
MPLWDENAGSGLLIGQKPPPPHDSFGSLSGAAAHLQLMHVRVKTHQCRCQNECTARERVPFTPPQHSHSRLLPLPPPLLPRPPSLAHPAHLLCLNTPPGSRSLFHLGGTWLEWSGQRTAASCCESQRQHPSRGPPNLVRATPDCWVNHPRLRAKPQRRHASRQVANGNGRFSSTQRQPDGMAWLGGGLKDAAASETIVASRLPPVS